MRKSSKPSTAAIASTAGLALVTTILFAAQFSSAPQQLTATQTLDLLFARPYGRPLWPLYPLANPAAAPTLRKVLQDKDAAPYHAAAWLMLGYIGDASDVARIDKFVDTLPKTLGPAERVSFPAAMQSLGLLYKRDVAGSDALLKKLLDLTLWKEKGIKLSDNPEPATFPAYFEELGMVADGYALSGKSAFDSQIKSTSATETDAARKERIAWRVGDDQRKKFREMVESLPFDPAVIAKTKGKFNGDFENPGPAVPASAPPANSPQNAVLSTAAPIILNAAKARDHTPEDAIIKDAFEKFEDVKKQLVYGQVTGIKNYFVLNGQPLEQSKDPEQMSLALDMVGPLHRILTADPFKEAHPANIRLESQSLFLKSPNGDQDRFGELLTVSWTLEETATIEKSALYKKRPTPTLSNDGNLIVIMKKINGKWYWTPFGS